MVEYVAIDVVEQIMLVVGFVSNDQLQYFTRVVKEVIEFPEIVNGLWTTNRLCLVHQLMTQLAEILNIGHSPA